MAAKSSKRSEEGDPASRGTVMQDELIKVATRLFQSQGIAAVSLQDIADEVGMTKAALYHYFDNRADLLRHVFGDWIKRDVESLRRVMAEGGTPREKLARYVQHHIYTLTRNIDLYSLSFSAEGELPAEVRREFRKFKRDSDRVLRDILTAGMVEGEFAARDETVAAFAIDGMCNWLWKWYSPEGSKSPDAIAQEMTDFILDGLVVRNEAGSPEQADDADLLRYHTRSARFHMDRVWELVGPAR